MDKVHKSNDSDHSDSILQRRRDSIRNTLKQYSKYPVRDSNQAEKPEALPLEETSSPKPSEI
jgi:hypothetical protein